MLTVRQFQPYFDDEEKKMVANVLNGDYLSESQYVTLFENAFATYVGARHCVLLPSGGIALYLAMKAVLKQKTVNIPAYAGVFAANAAEQLGCKVKLVDVQRKDACVHVASSPFIAVHANGRHCQPSLIEDCAQNISHHTKGAVSCYSFHATKHLTLGGMGGAVCTDDGDIHEKLQAMKDYGRTPIEKMRDGDYYPKWGTNYKVPEMNAAFGLVQLRRLPERLQRLKAVNKIYQDELSGSFEFLHGEPKWYPDILVSNAADAVAKLKLRGIEVRQFYKPLTYRYKTSTPVAEELHRRGLYLPCGFNLTDEQVKEVCSAIKKEG